jgi:hypothetical protein
MVMIRVKWSVDLGRRAAADLSCQQVYCLGIMPVPGSGESKAQGVRAPVTDGCDGLTLSQFFSVCGGSEALAWIDHWAS